MFGVSVLPISAPVACNTSATVYATQATELSMLIRTAGHAVEGHARFPTHLRMSNT